MMRESTVVKHPVEVLISEAGDEGQLREIARPGLLHEPCQKRAVVD